MRKGYTQAFPIGVDARAAATTVDNEANVGTSAEAARNTTPTALQAGFVARRCRCGRRLYALNRRGKPVSRQSSRHEAHACRVKAQRCDLLLFVRRRRPLRMRLSPASMRLRVNVATPCAIDAPRTRIAEGSPADVSLQTRIIVGSEPHACRVKSLRCGSKRFCYGSHAASRRSLWRRKRTGWAAATGSGHASRCYRRQRSRKRFAACVAMRDAVRIVQLWEMSCSPIVRSVTRMPDLESNGTGHRA